MHFMPECKICKNLIDPKPVNINNLPARAQYLPDKSSLIDDKPITLKLYACPFCSVIFLDTEPVDYYREVIRSAAVSEDLKTQKHIQFKEFCKKYKLTKKRVIEVGCGNGEFLDILSKYTSKAFGIEYNEESVLRCKDIGLNVFNGFLSTDDCRICDDLFDGFLLLMFLEHIPDPRTFLKGIYKNLTENAVGIIEVPNFEMIFSCGLYAEIMKDHLFYFNKQSMSILLGSCGFEIIEQNIIRDNYVLSLTVRKKSLYALDNINCYLTKINECFTNLLESYNNIALWGASHQTFFVLSQIKNISKISCIIDSADFKKDKFSPVTHIPIMKPSNNIFSFDAIIVSAGSYSPEIVNILSQEYKYNGDVYIFDVDHLKRI